MKTKAVRQYGVNDFRLEEFELPPLADDEILMEIISDSICMSTYKQGLQGARHARVNDDIAKRPIIIGHECAGIIRAIGEKWIGKYEIGGAYTMQPALNIENSMATIGYSYEYCGGAATFVNLPAVLMEKYGLLPFEAKSGFYTGSLAEPMSCIIGAFHSMYHGERAVYKHEMGTKIGGKSALLGCCGPMGLGAIDYMLNCDRPPAILLITDINDDRLRRAESLFPLQYAKERGVELHYLNTAKLENPLEHLLEISGGTGFDDVSVYAPVTELIELGDKILGFDGCLNFFAGPIDQTLSANFNFYNVHYKMTHVVGSSGGNTDDMRESLKLAGEGKIDPAVMITHICGINSIIDTTLNLPNIPGGKKLAYMGIDMELSALADFSEKGKADSRFAELDRLVKENNGLWGVKAEDYLLANFK